MDTKRVHRFGYRLMERADRKVDIHCLRDADAFNHIAPLLYEEGYKRGRLLINNPIPEPPALIPVDESFLKPQDVILLTTRPPLDDVYSEARKAMCPSYTTLEDKVFNAIRPCFEICARDQIKLARFLADRLPADCADRRHILFRQTQSADYLYTRRHEKARWKMYNEDRSTALFLVFLSEPWTDGPQLLVVFGVGGNETLIWTYLLNTRLWSELEIAPQRFVLAEMKQAKIPPRPNDLSFADNLEIRVLLNLRIEENMNRRAS